MKEFLDIRGPQPPPPGEADLASFRALQKHFERVNGFQFPESELRQQWDSIPDGRVGKSHDLPGSAILLMRMKKYTHIPVPALVIFATPTIRGLGLTTVPIPRCGKRAAVYSAALMALTQRQAKAFESGVPTARVVRLLGANHYVYLSNEADVLRELHAFLAGLS